MLASIELVCFVVLLRDCAMASVSWDRASVSISVESERKEIRSGAARAVRPEVVN